MFKSTLFERSGTTLASVFPGTLTGINDIIEIASGPSSFKAGDAVNYSSNFTSHVGNTWPISRYWTIDLYHSNGTYASQENPQQLSSSWNITTNPILPDFEWLLDANGRIFGEVSVSAQLNDGDIITNKMPIGLDKCNGVTISNQTYSSSATVTGCYVTLGNVTVNNNANLVVYSEKGVTINSEFNVSLGSIFETK